MRRACTVCLGTFFYDNSQSDRQSTHHRKNQCIVNNVTLKLSTYSAVRWTALSAVYRAVLQVVQVAILARLLQPEDYGLVAIITVILTFANLLSDFGMSSAYVHRQDITEEQRSSLFWLNIAASAVLTLALVLLSPLVSRFFGNARLHLPLVLSAIIFFVNALSQQIKVDAEKSLNFRPLMMIEVLSSTIGFCFAVIHAYLGAGIYAIVIGNIVTAVISTSLAWVYIAGKWRPMRRFCASEVRSFIGYGGSMMISNVATQIHVAMDLLIGGRLLGATQLGLYSVPRNLILQIQFVVNPIITRVGFPLIAQIQNHNQKVRTFFLKTINMTASTNAPIYTIIAFYAPDIISVLVGNKWSDSSELLRVLSVWGIVRSTFNPLGSLLFGMGRPDLALKWNIALVVLVPPSVWLGAHHGSVGLAFSMLFLYASLFVPGWYYLVRPICDIPLFEYCITTLRPLMISMLVVGISYAPVASCHTPMYRVALGALIGFFLYCLVSYFLNKEWNRAMLALIGFPRGT